MNYIPLFLFLFVLPVCYAKNERVVLNEAIDENLAQIRKLVKRTGFDPLKLPKINTTIYVPFFFTNQSVKINLTEGLLSGGITLERLGDFYLTFHDSTVRAHGRLHFNELKAKFNFSYDTSIYSDKGTLEATIKNVTVLFNIDFKLFELLVANPRLRLNYEDLGIAMSSNSLLSPITSRIADIASSHYKTEVLKLSSGVAIDIVKEVIRKVNKNLPDMASNVLVKLVQDAMSGKLVQDINAYYEKKYGKINYNNRPKTYIAI